jgi:hypothetical protein
MQIIGIRPWRKKCKERAEWKKTLRKLELTVGCNASRRKK